MVVVVAAVGVEEYPGEMDNLEAKLRKLFWFWTGNGRVNQQVLYYCPSQGAGLGAWNHATLRLRNDSTNAHRFDS